MTSKLLKLMKWYKKCGALRDLYNLKSVKNTHGGVLILVCRLKPTTLPKLTLFHGCFSRFLNGTNGTKTRNAPRIIRINHDFSSGNAN